MPNHSNAQTILGFDFGMKRIGVAVGQSITHTANALTTLKAQDGIPNWQSITAIIDEWQADTLVVGIPYNMDGSEQPLTLAARKFARRLQAHYKLPTHEMDERLTTVSARQALFDQHNRARDIKAVDSMAAKIILESWFSLQKKS